jgi:hypothetical protein
MALTDKELSDKIDRYEALKAASNEQKGLGKEIKAELLERGTPFTSKGGVLAEIIRPRAVVWMVDRLKEFLSRPLFEKFCPRKPDARRLKAHMAEVPQLVTCTQNLGAGKPKLKIGVEPEEDEDDE